uniref:Retrovirus-related Pol polyprotein from transposon TNT 1-94 n=1 Tax=Cajanus cajan TaxID=3821 RepID=A0A151S221_CAJCA|nr:hypothetical protein KK1_029436 [Cajanus cajan]
MHSPRHLHLVAAYRIIRYLKGTSSEYRAMSTACSKIIWLRGLLAKLGFPQIDPTPLYADNTSAI